MCRRMKDPILVLKQRKADGGGGKEEERQTPNYII